MTQVFANSDSTEKKLDPIAYDPNNTSFRPTLYLGVGNTGTKILRLIRRRLTQRIGNQELLPAIRFLSIDTDSKDLLRACRRGIDDGLAPEETFEAPLRRADEYRSDARMHLSWLSRRWIYNIPKSLRTEGIRPLGRLALATNIEPLAIRLRQVLSALMDPDSVASTASRLGLPPNQQPRVVLIGSVSGGSCSGMAIDLAYMVRAIMMQLNANLQDVVGFFTHSTSSHSRKRELSVANSLAFLNELYHFSCVEEYPGDETCGIPASEDGTTTFSSTYLVHLGDDLEVEGFEDQIDRVAEYLYLSTATSCSSYFDELRRNEPDTTGLPLRTVGLSRSGANLNKTIEKAAQSLRSRMADYWTDLEATDDFDASHHVDQLIGTLKLDNQSLAKLTQEVIRSALKNPVATVAAAYESAYDPSVPSATLPSMNDVTASYFKPSDKGDESPVLVMAMHSVAKEFVQDVGPKLYDALLDLIDVPGRRMAGTMLVADALRQKIQKQLDQIQKMVDESDARLKSTLTRLSPVDPKQEIDIPALCKQLSSENLKRFGLISVHRTLTQLLPYCQDAVKSAETFRAEISTVSKSEEQPDLEDMTHAEVFDRLVFERLQEQFQRLLPRVDQILQVNLLDDMEGFRKAISDTYERDIFHSELERATRLTVLERLKEMSLEGMFGDANLVERISQWMYEAAVPELLDCGGGTRWMHAYPKNDRPVDALVEAFQKLYEQKPTLIPATFGEVVSCIEAEAVPLDNVAMKLLENRTDSLEYATRLHTRTDISWTVISSMR